MAECKACQMTFGRRSNLRRHQRTSCPAHGNRRDEECRYCGATFYRRDVCQRHERRCREVGRERDQSDRAHVEPHQPEAASSTSQHHTEAGPAVDSDVLEVHTDPNDALAIEVSGRREQGIQADLPFRGHGPSILVRRGEIIVVRGRRYRMARDSCIPIEDDEAHVESRASQTTETSGLDFHERWSLRSTSVGFDTEGNSLARTEVTHTFSCPTRVLQTYGGPYNQFYVPPVYAHQPAFGGIVPPGARPPPRYPMNNAAGWENFFEQRTERHAEGL